ncbi:MAG: DUF393 domain-containing protein [Fermentimonas sp.]|nr:DUF393 domain-containing protein [Fermentimonas sp.]
MQNKISLLNLKMYHILFFDGECRYCNRWVQWVVDRDEKRCFRFASLQSEFAKDAFQYFNSDKNKFDSIVVLVNTESGYKITKKSEAVAFLFSLLKPDALLYKLIKLLPKMISDLGYDIIAAIRGYLLVSDCRLYNEEGKGLFLDNSNFTEMLFRFRYKK